MNFFPQLNSGAITQYPVEATKRFRTVINETDDGHQIRWSDASGQAIEWQCKYSDLHESEWNGLRDLHEVVEGRLQTFTFFDPMDNLLLRSEEFSHPVWIKDPFLAISSGIADPLGGNNACRLTSSGVLMQEMAQTVSAPGQYTACFSIWARGATFKLFRTGGLLKQIDYPSTANWTRRVATFSGGSLSEASSFGVALAPGSAINIFGAQLELQPGASVYRKTSGRSGIYSNARFMDDRLSATVIAPDRFECTVRVCANLGA